MTYVAAHKLRSGPSSDHKLFYSHYGTPCITKGSLQNSNMGKLGKNSQPPLPFFELGNFVKIFQKI